MLGGAQEENNDVIGRRIDWSKWAPVFMTAALVGVGGISTAAVLKSDVEQLKRRVEALETARLEDRTLLIELRTDIKWLRARLSLDMSEFKP